MKKLFGMLFAVVLCLSMFVACDVETSEGLQFTSNGDGTCYVSGIGSCTDTDIVIPSVSPDGDKVTGIGEKAFYVCINLTSITIPDSVTSIGDDAFSGCSSLTSIIVSNNNQNYMSIDGNLYSKDGKTLIKYPKGKKDTSFNIPDGVTSIGKRAFYGCRGLTSIVIPNSVTSIGYEAFYGCSNLETVYYTGSEEEWAAISIGLSNDYLTNGNIVYNYVPEE